MLKCIICSFASLFIVSNLSSQEVTLKPLPNVPVSYHIVVNGEVLHKTAKKTDKIGTLNLEQDLNFEIVQKENQVPEILATLTRTYYKHEGFGFTFSFDSKSIPEGNLPALKQFRSTWNTPFHIPLTTDEKYIEEHSDIHVYLDDEQKAQYKEFVTSVLNYMKNGERYKEGEILWQFNENDKEGKVQAEAKVAKITSNEVILQAIINGIFNHVMGENSHADLTFKADNTIQRSNAFLRSGNGTLNIRVLGKDNGPIPYIGEGQIDINANIKVTSSKK